VIRYFERIVRLADAREFRHIARQYFARDMTTSTKSGVE
jgi:hypothetical protein